MGNALVSGMLYFACVFGVGFALGTVRVLVMAPWLGERAAELLEQPVMLGASFLAARAIVARRKVAPRPGPRIAMGACALALLLATELGVVLRLRGLSLSAYLEARDPVAGWAYAAAVVLFGLMPVLLLARVFRANSPP